MIIRCRAGVVAAAFAALLAGCSSTTSGGPGSTAPSGGSTAATPTPTSSAPASDTVAVKFVTALFVHRDAHEAVGYVAPAYRKPALQSAKFEIGQFGNKTRYDIGAPDHAGGQTVIPVKDVTEHGAFLNASYKVHLTLAEQGGSWYVDGYKKVDWDASAPAAEHGPNPPFTCTPAFVTRLRGYPVATRVRHYPVPRLTPERRGVAGQQGLKALRSGELEVAYTRESTGLPQGPSRSMYTCFVKYVRQHGWAPDISQNKAFHRHRTANEPLLYAFYDSGSRFKGGNELTVRWFDSKGNFGLGALLSIVISPNQYLPDLPPPPR